jgi:hypothetical protein
MAETLAAVIPGRPDPMGRFKAGDIANLHADAALVPGGVPNVVEVNTEPLADSLLDVADLVRMFEESESSTYTARKESERDRDYYDNKQHTSSELSTLEKRGQPPGTDNRIKPKIDYLVGLEKQQRIDPKALPRTPVHEQEADAATQALRYVAEAELFDHKRSGVWRNMLVEGAGALSVYVEEGYDGEPCVKLLHIDWDRMFWDPHSAKADFSDAAYLGTVTWMDFDDAMQRYGDDPAAEEALENTLSTAPSDTYDDKPKHSLWADKKRKRVRICEIWIKSGRDWHFAEFTKGGILLAGPSPYQTDKGESDCGLIFQSAHVDRDNNRYGIVREMISLQDSINKRNSKTLHLLNTTQLIFEQGAFDDVEKARRQAVRPDGAIEVNPGYFDRFRFEKNADLATAQFQLLQEHKNSIDLKGPNATMLGDKAGGSASASGKAIIASQQGGMVSLGDLLDSLRHLDKRVFRAIWARIRQFWTAEKWIRVTDDERNVKWVGMNVDPGQMQMAMQQNPEMQEKIAGVVGNLAELDCDIIIDEAPDSITPALEQWQALTELAKGGIPIPPDVLIESAPNLKNKDKILDRMKEPNPQAQAEAELKMRGATAEIEETEKAAQLKEAQAFKTMVEAQMKPQELAMKGQSELMNLAQKSEQNQMKAMASQGGQERQGQPKQQQAPQGSGVIKRVVRGPDGRPAGIETVSPDGEVIAREQIVRDPSGAISGTQPI